MRKFTFLLGVSLVLFYLPRSNGQNLKNYQKADSKKHSIEEHLTFMQNELIDLNNYFTKFSNEKGVFEGAFLDFTAENQLNSITDQLDFIFSENLNPNFLRLSHEDLNRISQAKRSEYVNSLLALQKKFSFSEEEKKQIIYSLESIEIYGSYYGTQFARKLREYFDLAFQKSYTKWEVFRDATGYFDIHRYLTNVDKGAPENRETRGLSLDEAIRLLKDLEPINFNILTAEQNTSLKIVPNIIGFDREFKVEFTLSKASNISVDLFDFSGKKTKTIGSLVATEGFTSLPIDLSTFNIMPGPYIVQLNSENSVFTGKILILHSPK